MKEVVYLDYAAATPLDKRVLEVMNPYFSDVFYNPSATYLAGRSARQQLDTARYTIAGILGAKPAEVIFTAGATEANNLAIHGIMQANPGAELLISSIEHESVSAPAAEYQTKIIPTDKNGIIVASKLSKLISDNTVLVSIMLVNNEIGTVQPLREAAALINKLRKNRIERGIKLPIFLHTDAAQAPNYFDIHASRLGVDLMTVNGGKIYGAKQSGVLHLKVGIKLQPQILGGGQEFGVRAGTENMSAAIGLAKALEIAQIERAKESDRLKRLQKEFEELILGKIPAAKINGHRKHRAPHISSLTIPNTDNERLMMELDERGIMCAVGSACSASNDEASHVLSAIGLSAAEANSTLRFSFGRQTSELQLKRVVHELSNLTGYNR